MLRQIISAVNLSQKRCCESTGVGASCFCIFKLILNFYFNPFCLSCTHYPVNPSLYLLSGCSHSWTQQPFHQLFLQHDGIHPKPLRHSGTKIATGLRKPKNSPAGNRKKQISSLETLTNSSLTLPDPK